VRRSYYEDGRWPWRPDGILQKYKKQILRCAQDDKRFHPARALDLGMGYGRNALWLAERGFEVEGWELDGKYVREARREWRRRRAEKQIPPSPFLGKGLGRDDSSRAHARAGRLRVQQGDFARGDWRGPYDVIVISQALHQLKRSEALRVLRRAKKALRPALRPRGPRGFGGQGGGRLFLLAKLTRDKHVRRVAQSAEWERVRGEKNTWRRLIRKPKSEKRKPGERGPEFHPGRLRRRWTLLSALTRGEIRGALRGLRLVHYREVVLQSDWCAQGASASGGEENAVVTHTVAEVVGERT